MVDQRHQSEDQRHGMWLRWKEVQNDDPGNSASGPCAGDPPGNTGAIIGNQPRAHHAHCVFGTVVYATRIDRDPPASLMNWRERKDLPWIIAGFVLIVILVILLGTWPD